MWRILLFTVLGLVPLGLAGYWRSLPGAKERGAIQGREEATQDIQQGKLKIRNWDGWGSSGDGSSIVPDEIRERLNVKFETVGHGCVRDEKWDRMEGYNKVMLAEIERQARLLPPAEKK